MSEIILLRHAKVDIKKDKKIYANQLDDFIKQYDNSDITLELSNYTEIENLLNSTNIHICSKQKRSIQSLQLFKKIPYRIDKIFNEATLNNTKRKLFKLSTNLWLIIFRILWLISFSNKTNSYKQTKIRAKKASQVLINLANEHKKIILIGHGIMNNLIQKELLKHNYILSKKSNNKNWDYSVLKSI